MICTSYYAKAVKYPDTFRIGISLSKPSYAATNCDLKWLAPTWEMLARYKKDHDENAYIFKYLDMLAKKDATLEYLVERMLLKEKKQNVLLLCWEAPDKFCHRHLLAKYLNVRFKTHIVEL